MAKRELTPKEIEGFKITLEKEIKRMWDMIATDAIQYLSEHYNAPGMTDHQFYFAMQEYFIMHGRMTRNVDAPIEWGETGYWHDLQAQFAAEKEQSTETA